MLLIDHIKSFFQSEEKTAKTGTEPGIGQPPSISSPKFTKSPSGSAQGAVGERAALPQSEEEAKRHILRIRADLGLDGPSEQNRGQRSLERSINLLSDGLYRKNAHFLLELIQNADDTSYTEDEPALSILYENRTLCFRSNQIGFTMEDVEAICNTGHSTKIFPSNGVKRIGHKGIGFKSVFKVADVVWIISGHYSFKFVKSSPLGCIAPTWDTSRRGSSAWSTTFYLELSPSCDAAELVEELKRLESITLVFLRNLRKIRVEIADQGGYDTTLMRPNAETVSNGLQLLDLPDNNSYAFCSYRISIPLSNGSEISCEQSDIVLGFPYTPTLKSPCRTYDVYAFLPIRDYGFKFILQADFQLVTSREEIDASSTRNRELIQQIPDAFLQAVNKINAERLPLRYSWPHHLPSTQHRDDCFKDLWQSILQLMSDQPILESLGGDLVAPSKLSFYPSDYADEDGNPLVPPTSQTLIYASPNYYNMDNKLEQLGVHRLSDKEFLNELALKLGVEEPSEGKVCESILSTHQDQDFQPQTVPTADLISHIVFLYLTGWRCGSVKPSMWFAAENGSHCSGTYMYLDSDEPFSARKMFAGIPNVHFLHQDYGNAFESAPAGATKWKSWIMDNFGLSTRPRLAKPERSSELSNEFLLLVEKTRSKSTVLEMLRWHWEYYKWVVDDNQTEADDFPADKRAELLTKRRLRAKLSSMRVMCSDGSFRALSGTYLRRSSILYGLNVMLPFALPGQSSRAAPDQFPAMEQFSVRSDDTTSINLGLHLQQHSSSSTQKRLNAVPNDVRLLSIPEPEDTNWDFLKHFGVTVQLRPSDFIDRLAQLREVQTTKEQISKLYEHLYACMKDVDHQSVRESFDKHKLIYIPPEQDEDRDLWFDTNGCVWDGPSCLKRVPRAGDHFSNHAGLFLGVLRLPQARLKAFLDEASQIQPTDSLKYIRDVFTEMARLISTSTASEFRSAQTGILKLRKHKMFPIWTRDKVGSQFDLVEITSDLGWYIADRPYLFEGFQGRLPLLAFSPHVISELGDLLRLLRLDGRMLSKLASKESKVYHETSDYHASYSEFLQRRARHISRLVQTTCPNRNEVLSHLSHINVLRTDKIEIWWQIEGQTQRILTESGVAALKRRSGGLDIFLVSTDCEIGHPPPELAEELAIFCGINDVESMSLLTSILTEMNLGRVEASLRRRSIPDEIPTWDSLVQNNSQCPDCNPRHVRVNPDNNLKNDKILAEDTTSSETKVLSDLRKLSNLVGQTSPNSGARAWSSASWTVGSNLGVTIVNRHERGINGHVGKTELSHVSKKGPAHSGSPHEPQNPPTRWRVARQASTGISQLLPSITVRDHEAENESVESEAQHESSHRGRTFSPSPQTNRSTSRTPSTHYIESGDHVKGFSPGLSPSSRTQSNEEKFMNIERGWMTIPPPMTIFYGNDTQDTRYFGELYVSRYLETFLGDGVYKPEEHWTSPLRSRNGLPQYTAKRLDTSTFTIKDTGGKLRDAIIRRGHVSSDTLADCVTVHVELKSKHLRNKGKKEDIYILARVYRVWDSPGIAMYVDPWQLQKDGSIILETESSYRGHIGKSAPTFLEEEFARISKTAGASEIYDGLAVGPGQIRLLRLQHADDDRKPLSGSLEIAEVDELDELDFWAISYVWGREPAGPNPSTFTTENGTIPITESLSSCLKCLRRGRVGVRIWADALCINQQDNVEKSIQVRRLGSLYEKASRVIVWLGSDGGMDEPSPELEWLADVHNSLCLASGCCSARQGTPGADPIAPNRDDKRWGGINEFLKRPWFTRAWIVQELALGSDVSIMSGRSEMKWDCFMETLLECQRHFNRGPDGGGTNSAGPEHGAFFLESSAAAIALHRTRQIYHHASQKFRFLQLLEMFAYTDSSRSCDKMFSLLNLAADSYLSKEEFDPDYVSADEMVMEKYARGFVSNGAVLELLYHAGHGKSTSFCSWIPDFMGLRFGSSSPGARHRTYPPTISTWKTRGGNDSFYAGPRGLPRAEVRDNSQGAAIHPPPILAIRGYIVDEICDCFELGLGGSGGVATFATALQNMRRYISYLDDYSDADDKGAAADDTGLGVGREPKERLLLRLLVGDSKGPQTGPAGQLDSLTPTSPTRMKFSPGPLRQGRRKKSVEAHVRITQYWQTAWAFANRIPGAAFCTTRNSREPGKPYAGIVPGEAKTGDRIFVPNGGKVPFVLRKVEGKPYYTLIGECCIHGIMYSAPSVQGVKNPEEVCII
ncbi:hypothetical protein EKO27_g3340 [Xylaria grammica]|uniref:Uncharacterized protein n=1 Tax=Xylaria grammica TaxID=363999 RepID=A0A439DBL6_9PEZI|nr:hypothetical protein EKO27_g3340 [Xylaria grammica]